MYVQIYRVPLWYPCYYSVVTILFLRLIVLFDFSTFCTALGIVIAKWAASKTTCKKGNENKRKEKKTTRTKRNIPA